MDALPRFVLYLPVLLLSIVLHEYAHARVAATQGDHTAEMLGRVTLNPLPHIDPIGTLLVPFVLFITHAGFLFGWAKPVPVNGRNFRNYRRGDILVSLAGVTANFLLAIGSMAAAVLFLHLRRLLPAGSTRTVEALVQMALFGVEFNILLGIFNLIPIPPLDGSHVLYHLLPPELGARYRQFGRYGVLLLLAVFFVPGLIGILLAPVGFLTRAADQLIRALA